MSHAESCTSRDPPILPPIVTSAMINTLADKGKRLRRRKPKIVVSFKGDCSSSRRATLGLVLLVSALDALLALLDCMRSKQCLPSR
jgi:hypothetical protein